MVGPQGSGNCPKDEQSASGAQGTQGVGPHPKILFWSSVAGGDGFRCVPAGCNYTLVPREGNAGPATRYEILVSPGLAASSPPAVPTSSK